MPLPIVDVPLPAPSEESAPKIHRRFDRAARLVTEPGLHRLMSARVVVFGMGGVGSFAAEALARSGVGTLALVDFDDVCVTNTNRQLHAMKGNVGKPKADIMAERLRLISPTARIEPVLEFYEASKADALLSDTRFGGPLDFVVDAIDSIGAKAHLLSQCLARGLPVVSSMGAAGRLDPTRVRVSDLADTEGCGLARDVRGILRKQYGLKVERGAPTGIAAVFSDEPQAVPAPAFASACLTLTGFHRCMFVLPRERHERTGEPVVRYYRYTLNLVVAAEGVPEGMARDVFFIRDPERALAGTNCLHLETHPRDARGRRLLCVEALLPRRTVEEEDDSLATLREALLAAVAELVPFLDAHLLYVDSPHDARPARDVKAGQDRLPAEKWARGPKTMEPVLGYPMTSMHGLAALPTRTPIPNLLLCNEQVLPGLGLEGVLLAAWAAARTVGRSDGRRDAFRRGLFRWFR